MHGFSLMGFIFIVNSQDISVDFSCTPFVFMGFSSVRLSPSIDLVCVLSPLLPSPLFSESVGVYT